jgi:LEA14-like dessication related protein
MSYKSIFRRLLFISLSILFLSSCGKYNDISVKGMKGVKLRGLNKNQVLISIEVEIDNPNPRKITITDINLKAWLSERELGDFRITEPIKLIPCSKSIYSIPAEIELRTIADALRLASSGSIESLIEKIEVEGKIKAKSFPVRKTIRIKRQPFKGLAKSL